MYTQQKDIFICHASEDKAEVVRPLYECLESEGFNIWYDEAEIKWGDSITEKVNWGLIHSRYVVVVLSESFLDKKWPNREFNSVVNIESSGGLVKVLPLLVGDDETIGRISATYPLVSDKKYLIWRNNQTEIVAELFKIFPERKPFEPTIGKDGDTDYCINTNEILRDSIISITTQTVRSLNDIALEGIFIKPDAVNGISFETAMNSLLDVQMGATLLVRYLDKAIWSSYDLMTFSKQKLFIEIPALYCGRFFLQELICALAKDAELPIENLVVLIPEPDITSDTEGNYQAVEALKKLGVKVGVSQFGTGYSSLLYLKKFEFSHLFIDSSFLNDVGEASVDLVILKTICSLSKNLKVTPAIDNVETEGQKALLKSIGFNLVAFTHTK